LDERRESEATPTTNDELHGGETEVRVRTRRHANRQRPCAPCVRGVDQGRTVQEVVGTKVVWSDPAFWRDDVRAGGKYRLVFSHRASTMEFFGTYREVTPHSRLVWTNEEGDSGDTVTTVTVFSPERKSYCPFPGAGCEVRGFVRPVLTRDPQDSNGGTAEGPVRIRRKSIQLAERQQFQPYPDASGVIESQNCNRGSAGGS
jgi:hypothetical protein